MKKSFLAKAIIMLCLFCTFFLTWQINSAKAFCETQKACIKIPVHVNPGEINSIPVFPYNDFLIKV
ncbi:MAG: hypothetical protein ABI359_15650 [Ginsengibacter sp.]